MRFLGLEITRASPPPTRFLGDLVKVTLSPGDVCVLMSRRHLTQDEASWLRDMWRASIGDAITLIVIDDGMRLGVLSPPEAAAVHERLSDASAVAEAVGE